MKMQLFGASQGKSVVVQGFRIPVNHQENGCDKWVQTRGYLALRILHADTLTRLLNGSGARGSGNLCSARTEVERRCHDNEENSRSMFSEILAGTAVKASGTDAQPDATGSVLRGLGSFPNKQKIAFVSRKPCLQKSGF